MNKSETSHSGADPSKSRHNTCTAKQVTYLSSGAGLRSCKNELLSWDVDCIYTDSNAAGVWRY